MRSVEENAISHRVPKTGARGTGAPGVDLIAPLPAAPTG